MTEPRGQAYFERLYAADPDPWRFASSDYERTKYAATLAALPVRRFSRGFEVGCSIGVLTRQLATRCNTLLAVDVAPIALDQARVRCEDLPSVTFVPMAVPDAWPEGGFDLIVFSEVLYYLDAEARRETARRTVSSLLPGGVVVLVNWRGETGSVCTGDEAAAGFVADTAPRLCPAARQATASYRLDVLLLRG